MQKTFTLHRPITGLPYITGYSPDDQRDVVLVKDIDPLFLSAIMLGLSRMGHSLKDTAGTYLVGSLDQLDPAGGRV